MEKLSSEITYEKTTTMHTIEVNGKEVRVYEHKNNDYTFSDYNYETFIDEQDIELLTEEEREELEDNLTDLINK